MLDGEKSLQDQAPETTYAGHTIHRGSDDLEKTANGTYAGPGEHSDTQGEKATLGTMPAYGCVLF